MIRSALRSLLRVPAFSATAVLTIALGIGVNTAIFSVIQPVLLEPLPYRTPERLVHISETHPDFPSLQVAAPDYFDWRKTAKSFEQIGAYTFEAMNQATLLGQGEPERVQATQASHELFPMLGIQPLHGRAFTASEESGRSPVVLLSESLWRRKFAANPSIVGHTIRLDGLALTVLGIVPKRQAYPSWADLWMPLSFLETQLNETRRFHPLEVVARLKPGVSIERAQAEMQAIAAGLSRAHQDTNKAIGAVVIPMASRITGEVRPTLLVAWAAVSLVLLLACANVAHLVMVRSVHRSREMAVRAALGASRWQLLRPLLAENLALALAGGTLGALLAAMVLPVLRRFAADDIPRLDSIAITPATLLFTGAIAAACALLFACPALFHVRRIDIPETMKHGAGLSLTNHRSLFGAAIVGAEIALAFVVITGAGMLYRSFVALMHEDPGFAAQGVLAVEVPLAGDWEGSSQRFEGQLAPRLRSIPGVTAVAAANCAPMTLSPTELSRYATRFGVTGHTSEPGRFPVAQLRWITPDYFQTLRIPLVRGRLFSASDARKPGFIINETLARRFFPGQDPVGRKILMDVVSPNPQAVTIVGVVGNVRDLSLDLEPRPTLYSLGVSPRMTLLIGAGVNPSSMIPAVRDAIRAIDAEAPITRAMPLSEILDASLARRRFALSLLGVFASLAAVLTMVGVYGVIAYFVSLRTREFAIRFAIGAQRSDVRRLVLRNFTVPVAAGLLAGAWLAHLFALAMRTQLYKVSPSDPWALTATGFSLMLLVAVSALQPAARAASVPPVSALRE